MNLLDKCLASRRLEEQYQDIDIDTFGDEYLNLNKQDISTTGKRPSSGLAIISISIPSCYRMILLSRNVPLK